MRKDQWNVTVSLDGNRIPGPWDIQTGGEVDSDELKYKPGAMGAEISLGGSVTIGQVIVSRIYLEERDAPKIHGWLERVGKGNVVVKKGHLDVDKNAFGTAITYKGKLKRITPPEVDSTSTEAAVMEWEITPEGTVT